MKDLIEKIFRRKELADLKEDVQEKTAQIKRLTTGDSMHLSQQERRLILLAIKFPAFWADAHPRPYRAYQRILRKDLIEKLKMSIKKEDDETKEVKIENP